jgi:hypothetical protein
MTEGGGEASFPAGGPAGAKLGWYKSKSTGNLRFWNGEAWTDLSQAITPFAFESEPEVVLPPPTPTAAPQVRRRTIDRRGKLIAASAAALVVVLAIVLPLTLGNDTTPRLPSVAADSSPAVATTAPGDTTTTDPFAATVTTPTATSISDPGVTGLAGASPGVTSPVVTSPVVTSPVVTGPVTNVAIIGDSIDQLAQHNLTRSLRLYNVYFDAVGGTTMADHLVKIERIASGGQPRDWVIELGTNDALGRNANWAADFANEVAAVQAQTCVVFVTVNIRIGPISTGINDAIANAVATHANFHMLDWGNIELRNPQWLQPDGIHPTKSGDAQLAKLEHKAVVGCQGG